MVFAVVEQKEPHAGRMAFASITQPATFAERHALAVRMRDELEVPLPIWIDGMDDASRALFSDLPSPAFVIDRDGRIAHKLPWADATALQPVLARLLAAELPATARRDTMSLAQRVAVARRLLVAGKTAEALAWLDAKPAHDAAAAPTPVDTAHAALVRVLAVRDAGATTRDEAIAAARTAIAAAWSEDSGRLAAARIELAEAARGADTAAELWRDVARGLDARAPALTRDWVARQARPVEAPR